MSSPYAKDIYSKAFPRPTSHSNSPPWGQVPKQIEVDFPGGHIDTEIESNSPYREEAIEQEYIRLKEKYYRGSPDLKQQINISELVHKFSPKQIDLNKVVKLTERIALKETHLPVTKKKYKQDT